MPSARGVEVRHLRAFVAVAEELHFGRAAQRLHMAQPPLSQMIRGFESALGTQLFERTSRSVRITPAGELMLERAKGILRDLDRAIDDVGRVALGQSSSVRVGFNDMSANERIPRIVAYFARENPGVQLQIQGTLYSGQAAEMVRDGILDVAVIHGPVNLPGVESMRILTDPLVAVVSDRHRVARDAQVTLLDLADDDWLTYPDESGSIMRDSLLAACAAAGFRPRIVQTVEDTMTLIAMVAAGFGVSVLSESVMAYCPPGAVYRPLVGSPSEIDLTICWNTARESAEVRKLIDTVLSAQ